MTILVPITVVTQGLHVIVVVLDTPGPAYKLFLLGSSLFHLAFGREKKREEILLPDFFF